MNLRTRNKATRFGIAVMAMVLAAWALGACAPAPLAPSEEVAAPTTDQQGSEPSTPQAKAELPSGALPAAQMLARALNIEEGLVEVISVEQVEWPDACLGVEEPGTMCAQVITPGYRIVLEAQGQRHVYHTNLSGTQVRPAAAPAPQSQNRPVLAWHREGGIAGFCDDLVVYPSGEVKAASCKNGTAKTLAQSSLEPDDLRKLESWVGRLASFEHRQTDEAKADAMIISMVFTGQGEAAASERDKQDFKAWAAQVFAKLTQ